VTSRGANYTSAVVTFDGDGSAAAADVTLSSQVGSLRTYYIQAQTGEKIIINEEAGVVNYATGTINLINFKPLDIVKNPNYDYGILTINAETDDGTIYPKKNRILLIDNLDPVALNIRMVRKPLNITI
jgi:hypothetical protein